MHLLDIGANLTHESFRHDFDEVLARAREHGVTRMVVTGASREASVHALELARRHPGELYATAGVHPHHAVDYDEATDALLRELHTQPEMRAVGETGLDYHRNYSPREVQLDAFERQLRIAAELGKPLFLHQRDAHEDFLALLRRYRDRVPAAVVHCFTDTGAALRDYLALDCHRHHRLDLRRTPRHSSARAGEGNSRRPPDDRDGCAVSIAAHGQAAAQPPAQRADVPAAYLL